VLWRPGIAAVFALIIACAGRGSGGTGGGSASGGGSAAGGGGMMASGGGSPSDGGATGGGATGGGSTCAGCISGPFAEPVDFSIAPGGSTVVTGDFNGDGKVDVAVLRPTDWMVSVLINTTPSGGNVPAFLPAVDVFTRVHPSGLAAADFDRDGRLDFAVGAPLHNGIAVLLNRTGAGATSPAFADGVEFDAGQPVSAVLSGDFNGDGIADIAGFGSTAASVLVNQAAPDASLPSFADAVLGTVALDGGNCQVAAVGDLDANGSDDLICSLNRPCIDVDTALNFPSGGAPTFSGPQEFTANSCDTDFGIASAVGVGDFNSDGRLDVVFMDHSIEVLASTTDAGSTLLSFAAPDPVGYPFFPPGSFVVTDFDQDSRLDLGIADDGWIGVSLNTTSTTSVTPTFDLVFADEAPAPITAIAAGDLSGDSKPDLVVLFGSTVRVYLMR
jgi:hypothetical protein